MALATRHWDRLGNGGLTFTELGFGTAPIGGLYRSVSEAEAEAVLEAAWAGGVRYYDTAPQYGLGLSELRLGRMLRGKPRGEYVVSTKVGRLMRVCPPEDRMGFGKWFGVPARTEVYDYGYDAVMRSFEDSLQRLGADRIDILYVHDLDVPNLGSPEAHEAAFADLMGGGYRALEALRDQGAIRAFGAGLNEWQMCERLTRAGDFDVFLLAGRYTLLEQEALASFLPLAEARGIGIVIGGPYNSGILATGPVAGAHYDYDLAPPEICERVRRIEAVCRDHGVPLVEAAFQFPLRHPAVVSVIPGGQTPAEMAANLRVASAVVPPELWADLKAQGLMREDAPT